MRVAGTPASCSASVVPPVARISNPISAKSRQIGIKAALSVSLTEMKTAPSSGRTVLAASWLLPKARPKSLSMPITSPVDFISGPRKTSTPGKRENGNTASFTATCAFGSVSIWKSDNLAPAIIREAILAIALPVAFATNGTVRLPLGFTSSK